jgi:predicted dehydrogenase
MSVCCDLEEDKLDRIRGLYPSVTPTQNLTDILDNPKIDAVVIATPVFTHFDLGKECLMHGKHVLIEKPIASSSSECLELIRLAEQHGKVLMVGHTFEYTAAVNKIREIINSGELGEIFYITTVRVNLGLFQPDINVIWDLAPHDISIILYILDLEPNWVNAQGKAHYRNEIEDVASLTLNFPNGVIAFIHNSWLDPNKIRRTTIVGSKKMLVYDDIDPQEKIKIYDKGVDAPPYYDTFGEFHFSYRYGDIYSPRIEDYEPLRKECEHFLECIRASKRPRSDGYSGLRVVSVLESATQSLKTNGKAVPVSNSHPISKSF